MSLRDTSTHEGKEFWDRYDREQLKYKFDRGTLLCKKCKRRKATVYYNAQQCYVCDTCFNIPTEEFDDPKDHDLGDLGMFEE